MPKRLLLGLLIVAIICPSVLGQDYGVPIGPEPLYPQIPVSHSGGGPFFGDVQYYDAPDYGGVVEPATVVCPPKLWEGSFELGLDGTEGNTQTFNYRLGFDAKRTGAIGIFSVALDYVRKTNQSAETAHRALVDARQEWPFADSPWSCFVHTTVDYDEFKQFDLRVAADAGLGYQIIETESTTLAARAGGGFSHEIGGPDDAYVPEAVFGLEFEHQLSERQKLTAMTEYMPNVTDFGDYRVNARAGWEVLIDAENNLSLRLSVLDRHDSTPNGSKPNDLDYTATLIWEF